MGDTSNGRRQVDPITLILLVVAFVLLGIALLQGRDVALAGLRAGGQTLWRNLALLLLGFIIAGLAQVLIPKELVTRWLGAKSGIRGILIACVVGGIAPGAPYATFPLVASLYAAGASIGAVVGFVTAWALWSVSRLPVEIALIDARPALIRYAVTFIVPPLAGMLAQVVSRIV